MAPLTPRVKPGYGICRAYDPAMCMFSGQVEHVSATNIFAGDLADGRQALIYSMTVTAGEPLAMVLPLPVPANGSDDAVEFVNLEGYADLFTDLKKAFPDRRILPLGRSGGGPPAKAKLVVHEVGAFVASYVPHSRDFARLDPRYRLPPNILAALPHYADWGFAVFQLAKGKQKEIHPMAMRFPRRVPGSLFFPLTHVHDGQLPKAAHFDHALYAQVSPLMSRLLAWDSSLDVLGRFVDHARTHGLIDPTMPGCAKTLFGPGDNFDWWLEPPEDGLGMEDLAGRGESYAYRVNTLYYYAASSHHLYPKWLDTTSNKLLALCRGIRDGLAELTARNARAWQLGPDSPHLQPYFMNGDQLWSGTDYTNGRWTKSPDGPGRIAFRPFGELVEQQDISLAFTRVPSQDDARAINRTLCEMLDRIARDA